MTRPQAEQAVKAFFSQHGHGKGRLNAKGLAAVRVGTTAVSFEWDAADKALICRALVYRFEEAPKARVLQRVLRAGKSLEFHGPSRALFVVARLKELPRAGGLAATVVRLVKEAVLWAGEKLAVSV